MAMNPTATSLVVEDSEDNFAELLSALGDIPLDRIRRTPAPGVATEADVIAALEAPRKRLCELIDGVLVEKTMGFPESILAKFFIVQLDHFVSPKNLGAVSAPDGTIPLWPGRVRIPDVAYFSWERFPGRRLPRESIPDLVPDLAVEILSKSNTAREMLLKRRDYFSAGVKLVWEVDSASRTVTIFTNAENSDRILLENEILNGGSVLPEFSLSLRDLFAELDRQG